jgi:hypothetical protein
VSTRLAAACAALALGACSSSSSSGKVVVAITVDWEGAYLSDDGIAALTTLREQLGDIPITHFVCAAYATKPGARPDDLRLALSRAVGGKDEVGMHVHAWRSLAVASKVVPKLSPSFLTGTHEVMEFSDDRGFDTDLDVYTTAELRAILRTSRESLERAGVTVSQSFRAGGYLGTPKVLRAIRDEGYTIDSSALDHRALDAKTDLRARLAELWPNVQALTPPYLLDVPGPPLLELPISATSDYTSADQHARLFADATQRLAGAPERNVFVVLALNQETAATTKDVLDEISKLRARDDVVFVTITEAAALAHNAGL